MQTWAHTVTVPAFADAHARRRKTAHAAVNRKAVARDAVLAVGVLAAHIHDAPIVTVPVHRDGGWIAVTIEFEPLPSLASARDSVEHQLTVAAPCDEPPHNVVSAVIGDGLVDPSHVSLRIDAPAGVEAALELSAPVEPVGAAHLLAQRVESLIDDLTSLRSLHEFAKTSAAEAAALVDQRDGGPVPTLVPLVRRFERSAARAPHAAAVTTPWTTWTYDELLTRTNDRSAMLERSGITPGMTVGLSMGRSADLVATLLAIWQLGAAFVPITESLPRDRALQMLADAGATTVITDHGQFAGRSGGVSTVEVDPDIRERRLARRGEGPGLDDRAYVQFTSGTTGRPKGIEATQRNLAHFGAAVSKVMPRSGWPCVMLATTALSFDPSLLELVWPLTEGWEVIVDPGRDTPVGPVARRRGATHLNGTPTMASLMMHDRDGREVLETVSHILLGGEAVRAELVDELAAHTRAEVMVCYGPTEATIDTTWGPVDGATDHGVLPIGLPLPGHAVDIVDRRQRSVGAFGLGELVVMGDAVARGYVNEDGEAAKAFTTHRGQRAYATGDIVWSDAEGIIHFVGRGDDQIKIRGHRIELGGVETRLRAHPAVRNVALVVTGKLDNRRIEAFVVEASPVTDDELVDWANERLIEAMVPSRFHRLEQLPLSSSEKVDIAALVALAAAAEERHDPRRELTPTETKVAEIFERVLDRPNVPVDRSVFELGANSVTAIRLISELEHLVEERIGLTTLLDTGSVESIARGIDDGTLGGSNHTLVPIVESGGGLPMYCVAGADGHAVNLRPLGEALGRRFYGLEFTGTDGMTAPDSTIEAMADRFASAVHQHRGRQPIVLGGYSGGGLVALEMANRLERLGTPVALLVLLDTFNPELERRGMATKVVDGLRELNSPEGVSPLGVVRSRLAADRIARDDNSFAAVRKRRVPNLVDLSSEFERAIADWVAPPYGGHTVVVRSKAVVPTFRGWERHLTGKLDVVATDAGHVRMMLPPTVDDLASGLRDVIEKVEADFIR